MVYSQLDVDTTKSVKESTQKDTVKGSGKVITLTEPRESPDEVQRPVAVGGVEYPFMVTEVYLADGKKTDKGGLNDEIIVKLDTLEPFLNRVTEKSGQIILFIENLSLKGVYGIPDINTNEIHFKLTRNEMSNKTWNEVLSKPSFFTGSKPVLISVGFENEKAIPTKTKAKNFTIVIVKWFSFWICFIIIILLLVILIWLAKNTEMLKEPFSITENGKNRPYSLALAQMAFWYFLVVAAIIMLFLITKEFPELNASVLILIGISSLTALSSTGINFNKINDSQNKLISLKAEKKTLSDRIEEINKTLEAKIKLAPDAMIEMQKEKLSKETRLNEVIETIPKFSTNNTIYFSRGFFRDLVSDSTGVSLHRFQIAVWTLVLGFHFCYSVWSDLKMPVFDETLLALMGISSGTYIGFKIPEQKS